MIQDDVSPEQVDSLMLGALKNALSTPPRKHEASKKKPKESQSK